ncbi:MAG: YfhL family 4Fe-4S dicluster ferredoxin [Chloroflexota bacterium]|nr:YfhL family 4Fe-4S dicluster ferredoxin [Chloroflexota bacterium]
MAYKINETCISCGACEAECKNDAISEGDTIYVIDADKCTECVGVSEDPRCVDICPLDDCVVLDPDKKEDKAKLLEKWRSIHPGEEPAAGSY